eukprot:GHVP01027565.1.p1 GENE.GHVP01027565.1~~GHVP01027565.1.p1  ORF type:complete len:261 (+),score=47.07 GHVP01027565.1:26-784(+)
MEFKILSDHFNFACEDFGLGIPQANEDPFPDELHRGNSFEPEFHWGLRSGNGEWYKFERFGNPRVKRIFEQLEKIWKDKNDVFEIFVPKENYLKFYGVFVAKLNSLQYFIHFVEPENGNHRRFWTIRLCNCGKIKKDINSDCVEQYEKCHTFTISWNPNLKLDEQKKAAECLWYVFELAPKLKEELIVPHSVGDEEDEGFKVLITEFESLWKKIDAKEPDEELFTSTDDEDDTPSDVPGPAKMPTKTKSGER